VVSLTFGGIKPLPSEVTIFVPVPRCTAFVDGSAMAIRPGRITINGKSILGTAAMSGVRRAALIDSAAMARCTTKKSVHQYPNDSTKPSPMTRANHSTPSGFECAFPIPCHECVYAEGSL